MPYATSRDSRNHQSQQAMPGDLTLLDDEWNDVLVPHPCKDVTGDNVTQAAAAAAVAAAQQQQRRRLPPCGTGIRCRIPVPHRKCPGCQGNFRRQPPAAAAAKSSSGLRPLSNSSLAKAAATMVTAAAVAAASWAWWLAPPSPQLWPVGQSWSPQQLQQHQQQLT